MRATATQPSLMFEQRIALLEGAEDAFATASGMAAVNGALMSLVKAGDHIVSAKALFGSCLHILENVLMNLGVEVTFVDGPNLDEWRAAVRENTKGCFFESMSNPTLEVIDIAGVSEMLILLVQPLLWTTCSRRLCSPKRLSRARML